MTDDEAKALGLRAVACPGWRLMPGAVDCDGVRVLRVGEHTIDAFDPRANGIGDQVVMRAERLAPPDFRDPATLGCLLALVRREWGVNAKAWLECIEDSGCDHILGGAPDEWVWRMSDGSGTGPLYDLPDCDTEAEALVAALEAAAARVQP
jgi:hypothetical protein